MKPLLVVNPRSGGGRTGEIFADMRIAIERAIGDIDVEMTKRPGDAATIAETAAREGRERIIAVGGDGTVSDVVHGVMTSGKPAHVGLIGQGTGGDFRKTLGIEHRLDRYLDVLANGKPQAIDVGRAEITTMSGERKTRHFVNILSAGMGGLVDDYVGRGSRMLGGTVAYYTASVKALVRAKKGALVCKVTFDGKDETKRFESMMIAVCNGRYFGSGMHVAPMAKVDDGRFEVVSMTAKNKVAFAVSSQAIYKGRHLENEGTVAFPCQSITIDLENEEARDLFLLDVDGEPLGRLPMTIEILPGACHLLQPS